MEADWEGQAAFLGYNDEREMLVDLYVNQGLSLVAVARRLSMGTGTILRHMEQLNIPRRPQGGANAPARKMYFLHLLDQRWVFSHGLKAVASRIRVNPSYVYKYKLKVKGRPVDALRTYLSDEGDEPIFGG